MVRVIEEFVGDVNTFMLDHVAYVTLNEFRIHAHIARNWTPCINLLQHGHLTTDLAIVANTIAIPSSNGKTAHWHTWQGDDGRRTVPANVEGRAFCIHRGVGHACFVRNPIFMKVSVNLEGITAVATRRRQRSIHSRHAIHDNLPRKHDIWVSSVSHDFQSVIESAHSAVDPTRAAILREVLVDVTGHKILSTNVAPVPMFWQLGHCHEFLACWRSQLGVPGQPALGAPVTIIDALRPCWSCQ
mmetsp:Transcript_30087/g.58112  ORF Transcript_30087/g.58112 Transcript_30087/m.58112 type:complete len:243 (+) Transcript_30087:713-1441(+)